MEEARKVLSGTMDSIRLGHVKDWGKIKAAVKEDLGEFVWKKTKRRPMILPIIMEV